MIEKIAFSDPQNMQTPKELLIFWAGEQKNIYMIDISQLDRPASYKNPAKIKLNKAMNSMIVHPGFPILYGGF